MAENNRHIKQFSIIKALRKNDRKVQEQVYNQYYGLMLNIAMRYTGNYEEARDVLSQSFLKIFTLIKKYRDTGSFEAWMKRIVINTAIDQIRKQKMKITHIDNFNQYEANHYVENNACSNLSEEKIIETIQTLPPMSRAVFNMFVMEGYKHKEISQELGISEGTSFWHLQNARKILIKRLEHININVLNSK